MSKSADQIIAGEALLRSLKLNGVDKLFMNPGSDFAPIIESYASSERDNFPDPVMAMHEHVVVTMAHGYYLATGQMQAAAVHVNVGLANASMALINAHSDDVPIFMMSGRNPLTEGDREGSRHTPIQYGQEMFDQTGIVREMVKWDYELRYGDTISALVDRGCAIARQEPAGSVYLSLPREPLCEMADAPTASSQSVPTKPYPDPEAIKTLAAEIAEAKNPLIICSRGDTDGQVGALITQIAQENSIAVSEVFVTRNLLATDFDCNIGGQIAAHLPHADLVLVVDAPVAWIASKARPVDGAKIIHLGPDPLFGRIPIRGYEATTHIQCNTVAGLEALKATLPSKVNAERASKIHQKHLAFRSKIQDKVEACEGDVLNKPFVAKCVSDIIGDGVIFAERAGPLALYNVKGPNRWFGNTQAGGLGWALPAALGFQLADKDRLVACIVGDGSYVFANPIACHQAAEAQGLALLTIILDNGSYDAVRISTLDIYPSGKAAKANHVPMVPFAPNPDYAAIAESVGCTVFQVSSADSLRETLVNALGIIKNDKKQVLINIKVGMDDGEK